jgi:SAM-dependent methyltransferase
LSIGSYDDGDGEGGRYRDYFASCTEYFTSEVERTPGCDLVLDVRRMPEIRDASVDAIYCSGVLEHVDDVSAAVGELTRVLRSGGCLLLGLPFRQGIHLAPHDFWRFTEHGIRFLLRQDYEIEALDGMDARNPVFPAAYWVRAVKR